MAMLNHSNAEYKYGNAESKYGNENLCFIHWPQICTRKVQNFKIPEAISRTTAPKLGIVCNFALILIHFSYQIKI